MDFAKLATSYYDRDAMVRAGEAAEILYTRALAYCCRVENDGTVPRDMLARLTPLRGSARARALVREDIFVIIPGGWRIHPEWWRQVTKDDLERTRQGARDRQSKHRSARRVSHAVTDTVTDTVTTAVSSRTEVEVEVDAAAAAALPTAVEILRRALDARKLNVRWDILTPDELAEIETLVGIHGDAPLIHSALREYQPDKPAATARAWLPGWRQLRAPGDLAVVRNQRCSAHDTPLSSTGACSSCAADKKAGNA